MFFSPSKLPFFATIPEPPVPADPQFIAIEEANALKATIIRLRKEKEEWEADLLKLTQERNGLKRAKTLRDDVIKDYKRKLERETAKKQWIWDGLKGADSELKHQREDIRALEKRNGELRR